MSKEQLTAVLVHGAGTGAWIWEDVQSRLSIPSVAIDVPLHESGATPDHCVGLIEKQLRSLEPCDFVIVLHSWAGVLAGSLANALGERIIHTVYLSAVIPAAGASFVDTMPIPQRWILRLLYSRNPEGLKPSEAMIRKEYCNDLSESAAQMVVDRFTVQRPEPYLTPVPGPHRDAASTYIRLGQDQSVPPALQRKYASNLQNPGTVTINAGHLAMLSRPAEVATVIEALKQDIA